MLHLLLILASAYLAIGLVFAAAFSIRGVSQIDPAAAHATWGFRVLVLPGATFLWPLLFHRWRTGVQRPPDERTAHRLKAQSSTPRQSR